MRKIIPIIFVAATVLVGCQSPSTVHTQTGGGTNAVTGASATISTNAIVGTNTNTTVSANTPVHVNTPSETLSENVMLGDLGAAFIVILPVILALKRS